MALTPINVQSLLSVPAPMASNAILGTPSVSTPPMSSDRMGYIPAFQPSTPYSATNLPEFMKGYQQTPSGRFVMSQGLLGVAPTIDNVQSLFSKGYASEYAPLEQKFQESFALDPSLFGNIYRAGGMIPGIPRGMTQDSTSGLAGAIAGGLALKELYPYAEDAFGAIKDVVSPITKTIEETAGGLFEDYVTQPIKETVIEPVESGFEKYVTQPIKETAIDPLVGAYKESALKKDIIDPSIDAIQDIGKKLDERFDKPEFINNIQEKAKEYIKQFKESDIYKSSGTAIDIGSDAFKAYGNIENLIEKPNVINAFKAIDSMNKLTTYLPENTQKSLQEVTSGLGPVTGVALDAVAVASIVDAFEDPSVENIANAYGGLDHFAMQGKFGTELSTGLPGAKDIAGIGSIVGGLKALEGGIESPGEALQVATGAATAAKMFGGQALSGVGAGALSFLGPAAAVYTAYQLLDKPGSTFGHAIIGRESSGGFSLQSESSKAKGSDIVLPETNAAMLALGELERNYGYKFNPDAWKDVNKRIEFDNGKWVRGANDVIIEALQKGALSPTEKTPQTIDFATLLSDSRKYMSAAPYVPSRSMSSYARGQERARQMQESGALSPEIAATLGGLDIFQINADIAEGFGNIDFSKLDFSGLPTIDTSEYQPAPQPESYNLGGQTITPSELTNLFSGGISFPDPFAGFTAPNYGAVSQPATIPPVAPPVASPVTTPTQVASYSPFFPGIDFSQIRF